MLDLGAGTGSFRVREMMHRVAYPLGVHVRADVNLTDIAATCTDGKNRITEVIDLPTTGVNTERIWLLEHFADWFNIHLGKGSVYHAQSVVSEELVEHLDDPEARTSLMRAVEKDQAAQETAQEVIEAIADGGNQRSTSSEETASAPAANGKASRRRRRHRRRGLRRMPTATPPHPMIATAGVPNGRPNDTPNISTTSPPLPTRSGRFRR